MKKVKKSSSRSLAVKLHENVPPDWYERSIKENLLQRVWHTTRFKNVVNIVLRQDGTKILDIGSADGTFTKLLLDKSRASEIIGIDVLSSSVGYSKKRFSKTKNLKFIVADAHDLPFPSKSFDAVFCLETLEHVEDPIKVAKEMYRVLKDNGYIIVLVPSENFLFRSLWPIWTLTRGKVWKGTHIHHFTGGEIVKVIKNAGFKVEKEHTFILGMLQLVKARKTK